MIFNYITILMLIVIIWRLFTTTKHSTEPEKRVRNHRMGIVLDTSAIMDGRIFELYAELNLEGQFLIPSNVLLELKKFADSNVEKYAAQKRTAQEGLDTINSQAVEYDDEFNELDADEQTVLLALKYSYLIGTLDQNMTKAARVKGVGICNPDDMFVSSRPAIQVGDELFVVVLGKSKQKKQAVGASEYGEVIIIEDAVSYLGKKIAVVVTQVSATNRHTRKITAKVVSV